MKLKFFGLPVIVAVMLGLVAVSCSKEKTLLDVIPADAEVAGTVKVKSMLEQAGYKFENGEAKSTVASDRKVPREMSEFVALVAKMDASGTCNLNEVAWCKGDRDAMAFTMLVSDRDKFRNATAEEVDWSDNTGDYLCGESGEFTLLLGKNRVWITGEDASDAVKLVENLIKAAEKSPISSMTGLSDVLTSDNLVNMVARQTPVKGNKGETKGQNPELEVQWATLSANVSDNRLTARSTMIEADGKTIEYKGLQPINQAVLAYVPESFNIAFGLGVSSDFDWKTLTAIISGAGGFQVQGALAAAAPYLQAIDGTIFLAGGPANDQAYSDPDPGNWNFIAMVHMSQSKINDLIGMIRSSLFMAGVSPKVDKDGIMMIPQYGMNLYVGNVDGYFAVSNMPFSPDRQNSLAPIFNGKDGAVSIDIPSLKNFGPQMPDYGVKAKVQISTGSIDAELSLNGASEPILQAILRTIL